MKKNLLLEINALRSLIREHDHNYFVLNNPTISDYEYDQLFKKLVELEKENPELITPDSPTQRVGSDLVKDFKSVTHKTPMLSLSNTYSEEELIDFDRRVREGLPSDEKAEYLCELKIDGVSVVSIMKRENFRLQQQEVMELAAKMLPQMLKQSALYL